MPSRAPRLCACGRTVPAGTRCSCQQARDAKRRAEHDATRPSASERGYDADWRKVRGSFLKAYPICSVPGCGKPATDADHVLSVRERPDLRLSWSNLRPYCHAHHSRRTAKDQGFAR